MNKRLRPIPYPPGSPARKSYIAFLLKHGGAGFVGASYLEALRIVAEANQRARNTPLRGERCEARTRRDTACQCKALPTGRCRLHGGLSTGPRTAAGKRTSIANLPHGRMETGQ